MMLPKVKPWHHLILLISLVLLFCAITTIGQVSSQSMSPLLETGDRVIHTLSCPPSAKLRGKVVIFRMSDQETYIKRAVAVGGDLVEVRRLTIYVNHRGVGPAYRKDTRLKLKKDEIFVLGDNRDNSYDSCEFGPIKQSRVIGAVKYRFWPPTKLSRIN